MPLYDYRCASCGGFREFAPMRESAVARACPTCGASSQRVIAAPFLAGAEAPSPGAAPAHGGIFGSRHVCGHGCAH
ncbi:MAG: zinc ribbon domain-containing protein [Burkholderiales bacterium]|nr:zinc ribbon domain-containing protein [Burkholderiales bacterium]MCE7877414.1 zinc ribbon domain-containing protein [Betaproteobacteria bacterium PRO3]